MHRKKSAWMGLMAGVLGLLTACAEVTTSQNNASVQIHRTSSYGKLWAPLDPTYRNMLYVGPREYYLVDYNSKVTSLIASEDLHAVALRFGQDPWILIFVHNETWWVCNWPRSEEPRPSNFPAWKEIAVTDFYANRYPSAHHSRRRGALLMSEAMGNDVMASFLEATVMAEFDDMTFGKAHHPDQWVVFFKRLPPQMLQALHTKLLTKLRQEPHPKLFSRLVLAAPPQELAESFGEEMRGLLPNLETDEVHPQAREKLSTTPVQVP